MSAVATRPARAARGEARKPLVIGKATPHRTLERLCDDGSALLEALRRTHVTIAPTLAPVIVRLAQLEWDRREAAIVGLGALEKELAARLRQETPRMLALLLETT